MTTKADAAISIPTTEGNATLMKTRFLTGERVVAQFTEEPRPCCGSSGIVRHIQLTTQRLIYSESMRARCTTESKPEMRQIFIKDVCDIMIEGAAGYTFFHKFMSFIFQFGCLIVGIICIILGSVTSDYGSDSYYEEDNAVSSMYYEIGGILLGLWFLDLIYRICHKTVPHIVIGTRCPHLPPFAIRLRDSNDRTRLLEELTTLMAKNE